jgi:hypothetical protein
MENTFPYQDISASRSRTSRRVATYENDDEQESEASGMEAHDGEFDAGQVLYQDSKEQSSLSSADAAPIQSRSDNNSHLQDMLMPVADSAQFELSDDQKIIFNQLDASNSGVDAAMRHLMESISEEKRIKDFANSANQG